MKGNVTRIHDRRQNYQRLYFEQGGIPTDAELNFGFDLLHEESRELVENFIGPSGSADQGWRLDDLTVSGGVNPLVDFRIGAGHLLLGGRVIAQDQSERFQDQTSFLSRSLYPSASYHQPSASDLSARPGQVRYDAVYLEHQLQVVNDVEDSELNEPALAGDAATVNIDLARVHVMENLSPSCERARLDLWQAYAGSLGAFDAPSPRFHSGGRLRIGFGAPPVREDPCAPNIEGAYVGRANHTIKVKLTAPDRFVWAYHNGDEIYRAKLSTNSNAKLEILTPFKDSDAYPRQDQIAEICVWARALPNGEKTAEPLGHFVALSKGFDPKSSEIELKNALPASIMNWITANSVAGAAPHIYVRFWQAARVPGEADSATGTGIALENTGVLLDFLARGKAGDYWTFSLRETAREIVYPKRMLEAAGQPPEGPERHVELLGIIEWKLEEAGVVGKIKNCVRRITPLWLQNLCVTLRVGDGETSYGDFNDLQSAINALPEAGGKILLLPGTHEGTANLEDRQNVTIEGCGSRTRLINNSASTNTLTINRCENVTVRDFHILSSNAPSFSGAHNAELIISQLHVEGHSTALSFAEAKFLSIHDCTFIASPLANTRIGVNTPPMQPLVIMGGEHIALRDCYVMAQGRDLTLRALGGVQVLGDSEHVHIEGNHIIGGLGHGITLFHMTRSKVKTRSQNLRDNMPKLLPALRDRFEAQSVYHSGMRRAEFGGAALVAEAQRAPDPIFIEMEDDLLAADFDIVENHVDVIVVEQQGCIQIDPKGNPSVDDDSQEITYELVAGDIAYLFIRENEITSMGGSGISVIQWFALEGDTGKELLVRELECHHNRISNTNLVGIANERINDLHYMGFGGICLDRVERGEFAHNQIEDIGTHTRAPSVGIYVQQGLALHIHHNRLHNIGRTESANNLNLSGINGGIIIDDVMPELGNVLAGLVRDEVSDQYESVPLARATETMRANPYLAEQVLQRARSAALTIESNQILCRFGMTLDISGTGDMQIAHNHLQTLRARYNPQRQRAALGLSIRNMTVPNLSIFDMIFAQFSIYQFGADYGALYLREFLKVLILFQFWKVPDQITFAHNHSIYEDFLISNLAICTDHISTPFILDVDHNSFRCDRKAGGAVLMNLLASGYVSTHVNANKFAKFLTAPMLRGAVSIGHANTTTNNHSHSALSVLTDINVDYASSANIVL